MHSRSLWIALAGLTLIASGCSGDRADSTVASLPADDVSLSAPANVATPPVDAAYIGQTMQLLENVRAEVRRTVVDTKQFGPLEQRKFDAIFTDQALDYQSTMWREEATVDHPEWKPNPGPAFYPVKVVPFVRSDCIWFKTQPDESAASVNPTPGIWADVVLVARGHDRSINPTPWVIKHFAPEGFLDEGQPCS